MSSIRVGAVSYLNARPLVYGLDQLVPSAKIVYDLPSRLADQLATDELDVALIPSVEYFHCSDYTIVSNACIACRGPVLSVKLFSHVAPSEIQTLALDEGSRASAALVRILLAERFGVRPKLESLPIGYGLSDASADAVLLIGDRAIDPPDSSFSGVWDLGDVWCRWAELPFVYAMWVARDGADLQGIDQALPAARDQGVENLVEIAAQHAPEVGLTGEQCLSYLRDNLHFSLGPQEIRGLNLFYRHAAQLGLVPHGRDLKFHDCKTA